MENPDTIDLGESEFQQRRELKRHLAYACFIALGRRPWRELVVDRSVGRRVVKQGFLLAVSWVLSRRIGQWTTKRRVGIVFTPGLGGYMSNLAVVLAGKIPVNLNFTLGSAATMACLRRADIDCVLSAKQIQLKVPAFPWSEVKVVDLVDSIQRLPKLKCLTLIAALYLFPVRLLAQLLRVQRVGDRAEAAVLFTSGSSGEPKGVVLSHRNILANCAQIDATGLLNSQQTLLANLPIFHSFGFTVTLWYPLLRGLRVVTVPSPLEVQKTAEAIEAEGVTLLLGTPTFLRPYLKRVEPAQLKSLNYVIAGAEKTPVGFATEWQERFGSIYLEGYGLTETSPVVSLNRPHAPKGVGDLESSDASARLGSVGRLLPGHCARILDPATRVQLSSGSFGLIALKGPNIFAGYLDDLQRTAEVKDGDWFLTGDLGRFDADGFLYIDGRLSRFSKIGGEMVPHGTVEEVLIEIYELGDAEQPLLAVAGRPDPVKGEVLVLLTVLEFDLAEVRGRLAVAGLSNLWMPKVIKQVVAIPLLATGKLDLKAIQELALTD
ncbi:MAG: acyl-[acyl-carrier-protein]-phospholipid O-acyltransferase [Lentimonas sp.]|jgi:acyl-[acyl-carrier-protein]-phospholipid O-acyltransferase/long-chain-fatty-acid--[acyl-carrier-protein] ligase